MEKKSGIKKRHTNYNRKFENKNGSTNECIINYVQIAHI